MNAKLTEKGKVLVVKLQGPIGIELAQWLRDSCSKNQLGGQLVFNLASANFVGSTGLQQFIEVVQKLRDTRPEDLRLVVTPGDLHRVLSSLGLGDLQFYSSESEALASFVPNPG